MSEFQNCLDQVRAAEAAVNRAQAQRQASLKSLGAAFIAGLEAYRKAMEGLVAFNEDTRPVVKGDFLMDVEVSDETVRATFGYSVRGCPGDYARELPLKYFGADAEQVLAADAAALRLAKEAEAAELERQGEAAARQTYLELKQRFEGSSANL